MSLSPRARRYWAWIETASVVHWLWSLFAALVVAGVAIGGRILDGRPLGLRFLVIFGIAVFALAATLTILRWLWPPQGQPPAVELEGSRTATQDRLETLIVQAKHTFITSTPWELPSPPAGWIITVQDVLITNRSKTDRVSLSFGISVALTNRTDRLDLLEEQHAGLVRDNPPDVVYLHGPLDIPPQKSRSGRLGFLVFPSIVGDLGGSMNAINEGDAILRVTDHVSGQVLQVRVPTSPSGGVSS